MMIMKEKWIITIICISCIALFAGCFESHHSSLLVEKLDSQPNTYYNLTNETLNIYPKLKKAIDQPNTWIPLSFEEQEKVYNFIFRDNDAKIIKYNGSFYEITLGTN